MADKIKKFFKKKKIDTAFKRAGPGYRLDESPSSSVSSKGSRDHQPVPNRTGLTDESKQAAAAALARLESQKTTPGFNTSLNAIQAQVRRELEAEKKRLAAAEKSSTGKESIAKPVVLDGPSVLAVQGIYFKCPLIGPEILSREEWNNKIREFLYEQLAEEKGLTACLILHSLNRNKEKVEACVETIIKYLENILHNPSEEKYRKIRMSNRIYQEKVQSMEGALQILEAAGFEVKKLPFQDTEEDFLVYPEDKLSECHETFEILIDAMRNAEPITLELDRNLQVLLPQQAQMRSELPPEFFNISQDELKREQEARSEAVERNQMLRTKAMREKDEKREMRKYRFALIRIRFPDGIMVQGTFGVYEKFSSVYEFARETLNDETLNFQLSTPGGENLGIEEERTLAELRLVPATVLNFKAATAQQTYLKSEIAMLVQTLSLS